MGGEKSTAEPGSFSNKLPDYFNPSNMALLVGYLAQLAKFDDEHATQYVSADGYIDSCSERASNMARVVRNTVAAAQTRGNHVDDEYIIDCLGKIAWYKDETGFITEDNMEIVCGVYVIIQKIFLAALEDLGVSEKDDGTAVADEWKHLVQAMRHSCELTSQVFSQLSTNPNSG